jgi:coenzyme F420-0:L-glutamate ligase/coenzyme F420-1:gamma-L-glutamate ligase
MSSKRLEAFAITGLPLVQPGDDLSVLIIEGLASSGVTPESGDVLVVAQKIVSKAENRIVRMSDIEPSEQALKIAAEIDKDPAMVELVLRESKSIIATGNNVLIVEDIRGFILANAGIDRSNIEDSETNALLLPEDSNVSAEQLRITLNAHFALNLGVVITDSVGRPFRLGTVGMAIGSAGVEALQNLRGNHDMFGKELMVAEHAIADAIAATAELLMGEGDEAIPVVLLRGLNQGTSKQTAATILRPAAEDLFRKSVE